MKLCLVLMVLVLCIWSSRALADVVEGNPDERASLLLGYGRGFGEEVWRSPGETLVLDSGFWRVRAVVTIPAQSWLSFLVSGSISESPESEFSSGQTTVSWGSDTVDFAVRIFLP